MVGPPSHLLKEIARTHFVINISIGFQSDLKSRSILPNFVKYVEALVHDLDNKVVQYQPKKAYHTHLARPSWAPKVAKMHQIQRDGNIEHACVFIFLQKS